MITRRKQWFSVNTNVPTENCRSVNVGTQVIGAGASVKYWGDGGGWDFCGSFKDSTSRKTGEILRKLS